MTEEANERLKQFLNYGRNRERKATNIAGVFLFRPELALHHVTLKTSST